MDALAAHPLVARLQRALAERPPILAERDEPFKEAAVALVLRPYGDDDADLLFIRRATRVGDPWSGQVGLPGGRFDASDPSLEYTALRETLEEVGLDLHRTGLVLGQLDDLRPRTPVLPPIIVRPFVCAIERASDLIFSEEVESARWIRVSELFAPGIKVETTVEVRDLRMRAMAYQHGDFTIWGMTERILTTFEGIWR